MKKLIAIILLICLFTVSAFAQWSGVKPMLGRQVNWAHPLSKGLVGHWLMNEGSGGVRDLSGNGRVGTFSGDPSWVAGKFGSVVDFDGDDEIGFTSNPLVGLTQFSISWWMNVTAGQTCAPLQAWISLPSNTNLLLRGGGGNLDFYTYTTGSVGGTIITYTSGIWEHFVATYDGAKMKMYKNAVKSATELSQTGAMGTAASMRIGGGSGSGSEYYHTGQIDDLIIYNRALSASEIALLYREPFCMFKQDLPVSMMYSYAVAGVVVTPYYYRNLIFIPIVPFGVYCYLRRRKCAA